MIKNCRAHKVTAKLKAHVCAVTFKQGVIIKRACRKIGKAALDKLKSIYLVAGFSEIGGACVLQNGCGGEDVVGLVFAESLYSFDSLHTLSPRKLKVALVGVFFCPVCKPDYFCAGSLFVKPAYCRFNIIGIACSSILVVGVSRFVIVLHYDNVVGLFKCIYIIVTVGFGVNVVTDAVCNLIVGATAGRLNKTASAEG